MLHVAPPDDPAPAMSASPAPDLTIDLQPLVLRTVGQLSYLRDADPGHPVVPFLLEVLEFDRG